MDIITATITARIMVTTMEATTTDKAHQPSRRSAELTARHFSEKETVQHRKTVV